MVLIVCYGE